MAEQHPVVERGEYPFPVLDRGRESRQLAWLRNHANYMTGNGLSDYLRAMSSIVRGLIVNLLIGLPYVLALAVGVGVLSVTGWGFRVALVLVFASLGWVMIAPVATRVWQVSRLRRTATTGSDSSIEVRDRFEGGLGILLLLTAATALCEALSYFLDTFHLWTQERGLGFAEFASSGTLSLGLFTGLARVLPFLAGAKKTVATVVVGTIGLLAPLIAVMFVADRLVFNPPGYRATVALLAAGAILWLVMAFALLIGLIARAFRRRFKLLAVAGLVLAILMFGFGSLAADEVWYEETELEGRLADLDFVVDTEFSVPTLTLGRTATVRAQRTAEVRSLAANMVANPPPSLDELAGFMRANLTLSEQTDLWLNYVPPEPTGDEVLFGAGLDSVAAHMTYIYWLAGHLDGALHLVDEVGFVLDSGQLEGVLTSADHDQLEFELDDLGNRLAYLAPLFEAYAISEDPSDRTDELLVEVLTLFDETTLTSLFPLDETNAWSPPALLGESVFTDLLPKGQSDAWYRLWLRSSPEEDEDLQLALADEISEGSPLADQFPLTALFFPDSFRVLHDDLYELTSHVRAVRVEVARRAVFSAQYPFLRSDEAAQNIRLRAFASSAIFAAMLAVWLWVYGWLTIDPNRTSLLAMYRDRLAYAFLVRRDPDNEHWVKPELDLDLDQLSRYDVESTAPYHLINCAVNLPASRDITIRDRKSDFFIFSKCFTGSVITGYCRSEKMEQVFPDMSISTAMAISAAAASPNMGRSTSRMLAIVMVILNLRLGYWVPNPRKLEEEVGPKDRPVADRRAYTLDEVIAAEKLELMRRWTHLENPTERNSDDGLFGIAFSGGGIRSATLNLGVTQALHQHGVFDHIDYMSTVSGGGYLGSSISVSMRSKQPVRSPLAGVVSIRPGSGINKGKRIVAITSSGERPPPPPEEGEGWQQIAWGRMVDPRNEFVYDEDLRLAVEDGDSVKTGEPLIHTLRPGEDPNATETEMKAFREEAWRGTFGDQFHWRTRPGALLLEFAGRVHERSRSVNVSDGGHVENLATIELLRRRCKFIIVGDGEMDASHRFKALTILLRTARVELGAEIAMNVDGLRLDENGFTETHWAIGKIDYGKGDVGYLLYLKSSMTGRESEDIRGYKALEPAFPHEPTSDQFFDEGQFESYRNLGYQMAGEALRMLRPANPGTATFAEVEQWFEAMWQSRPKSTRDSFEF